MNATVSVVIPTYYRNELLQDAIESVLQQDYEPVEIIVVDDSGEGNAKPVISKYSGVRSIIHEKNRGASTAYTNGIEAATGKYIQLLDDDDYLFEKKLSKTVELLTDDPNVGVAYCGVEQDDRGLQYPYPEVSGDILERALQFKTYPCFTLTLLMEREILTDITPLPKLPAGNDVNLIIELARRTQFDYVDDILAYRRKEESSIWSGLDKFEGMKQIVANQSELYDIYPSIRRAVLAERYEKEGQARLDQQMWSPTAILCFLKATYYADQTRGRCAGQVAAALLGQPGLNSARQMRDVLNRTVKRVS